MKHALIAALCLSLAGAAAHADEAVRSAPDNGVSVHYGDLDLSTVAGQDAFEARVRQGVREFCRTSVRVTLEETRQCRVETYARFRAAARGPAAQAFLALEARDDAPMLARR